MIKVSKYTTGMIQTNVYFCINTDTSECVIIDPAANATKIIKTVSEQLNVKPVAVLLTHGHFDHIMAAEEVALHYGVKIYAAAAEKELLSRADMNMSERFEVSITIQNYEPLTDGMELDFLGVKWEVLATPGHTGGSMCYFIKDTGAEPILFSGDTMFKESYGRTDLPTGSENQIMESIRTKLLVLPEETKVYPGHEGETTIANELKYNPVAYLMRVQQ